MAGVLQEHHEYKPTDFSQKNAESLAQLMKKNVSFGDEQNIIITDSPVSDIY